jgi:signal transduction histidine kinase/CheY-like chemotaxis protein
MEAIRSQNKPGNERLDYRQFQESAVQVLIVFTCALSILVILFGGDYGFINWKVNVLGLGLLLPGLFALLLFRDHILVSIWILFLDWLLCAQTLVLAFPDFPPFPLLLFPIIFAVLFISPVAGVLAWFASGVVAFFWLHLDAGSGFPAAWATYFFSTGGVVTILWLSTRSYQTMARWSWQAYRQGRDELDQAREQRGQLNQAVHDLAEANTQMMRLNQLLNTARYQAEEAERVKAEFVANVSHELRTPLNMILGYCELIMDFPAVYGAKLPARLLADIAAIQRNSQHLTGLINDVLDISQIEAQRMSLRKASIALQNIVREAVIAVQPLLESRNLSLKIEIPDELPLIYCDQTRIRQVLLNLISNAARVTEAGGITITVDLIEDEVKVQISDTGPGIAEEDLPKLFQPFRQLDGSLKRKHGGSGLGLNISRQFVELHGGKIGVVSTIGIGSCFWFTLPVRDRPQLDRAFTRWLSGDYDQHIRPSYANPQRILPRVVILEPGNVFYAQASRYLVDVDLETASTPEEAQVILDASPCQAVIVRGENEEQSSRWASEVMRSHFATPVVACCLPEKNYQQRLEVERYLLKPVDHRQFLDAIRSITKPVRSILLIDDDLETLQLFTRILSTSPENYRVLQSTNGEEALSLLHSRKVDLILLDLYMPRMNGFVFLEEKNKQPKWKDIPVIILTAEDPSRHPMVIPGLTISRSQGLSLSELFQFSLSLSDCA